jgi:hypothetical protein
MTGVFRKESRAYDKNSEEERQHSQADHNSLQTKLRGCYGKVTNPIRDPEGRNERRNNESRG